jgi:Fibronectin type III domain
LFSSAPTAPRNLEANNIFQHSVYLKWNRPKEVNGEAMTYQLWYNDRKININDKNTMNETFAYKLQELEAFTNYIITVVACTSYCSEPSESLTLRTAMGEPGQMFQPKLESLDGSKVSISWEGPKVAGGNLDYFQIKTILPTEKEAKVYRINGRARSCIIQGLKCENNNIDFSIRSINVEYPSSLMMIEDEVIDCFDFPESNEKEVAGQFYGEWSQPVIYFCEIQFSLVVMGTIFIVSLFLLFSIYLFIRLYHKYKEMKDIHIVLPKGLDPNSPNSPDSSPSKKDKIFDAVKDFDLIKDHVLTDIEEEEEDERKKFISAADEEFMVVQEEPRGNQSESGKSEMFLPFICNPKTNEIFYTMPKMSTVNERVKTTSTPASPKSDYMKFNPQADAQSDYVKMYAPIENPINSPVEGYLDMTGKSPTSPSTPKILVSPPMPKESDYLVNEIKMFIKDSEMNNNGYIGKRASVLNDASGKKHSTVVNSNGYVGLQ